MSLKLLPLSHGPRKFGTSDFPSDAGAAGAAIALNSVTANMPTPLIHLPLLISNPPCSKVSPESDPCSLKRNLPQPVAASRCEKTASKACEIVKSPLAHSVAGHLAFTLMRAERARRDAEIVRRHRATRHDHGHGLA